MPPSLSTPSITVIVLAMACLRTFPLRNSFHRSSFVKSMSPTCTPNSLPRSWQKREQCSTDVQDIISNVFRIRPSCHRLGLRIMELSCREGAPKRGSSLTSRDWCSRSTSICLKVMAWILRCLRRMWKSTSKAQRAVKWRWSQCLARLRGWSVRAPIFHCQQRSLKFKRSAYR